MLQENNGFTLVFYELLYVLINEMEGRGSAKQVSEITGRPYQAYNLSMDQTVENLRKKGYIFVADLKNNSQKERYWSHFFNGYYDGELFIWEVKKTLKEAFVEYLEKLRYR